MVKNHNEQSSDDMQELRKRAETQARRENKKIDAMGPAELSETLHELRTHQIELEMQNEQLRQAQDELLTTQERLTDLYDFAPVGYLTLSEKGLLVEANMTCAKMLGVERSHLLRRPFSNYVVDEDQDIYFSHRRLAMDSDKRQTCELRLLANASEPFWASLESVIKTSDDQNTPPCLRISIADISKRHMAQEMVETSAREWKTTFDAINDSVALLDENGMIRRCNKATVRLLDRPFDEIVGQRCWELMHGADKPLENCPYMRMKKSLQRENQEIEERGKWFNVTVDPLLNDAGELTGAVHTVVDITDHKRDAAEMRELERQVLHSQKLESLDLIAGGIAHDFNNILTIVIGNLELALDITPQDSNVRRFLVEVENGAKRAADLSAQMLIFSGRGLFVVSPLDMNKMMDEITNLLKSSISKKAEMKTHLATNLPAVKANASQIEQIVLNLILNASEAIDEVESGTITITTGVQECNAEYLAQSRFTDTKAEGKYVFIEVTDTGCGMDAETLDKIFDPFYTTKFVGRGLGLSAVIGIVRGHNGAIRVQSKVGKGTTIQVLIPALAQEVEKSETAPSVYTGSEDWKGTGTVLIVDDEEPILRLAAIFLKSMGFDTLQANDGQEGVDVFRTNTDKIVCVLLDLTMPRMNGAEASLEMQNIRKDIPVILCSGYDANELVELYDGYGMAGFIQKPYTKSTLHETLQKVFAPKK